MAGSSGLALAGVEAIVEGLTKFQSDTRKMNSALDAIKPRTTLLMRGFEALTTGIFNFGKSLISGGVNALAAFGKSIVHIAEVALGVLLRDAINAAIGWIKEFVSSTIEAGSELQLLQLRLDRLNFNELKKSGEEYTDMMGTATKMTQEQLKWLIRLAANTPYDNSDIANVYTLARSYGFAAEEAKGLTSDIVDFASGMGLTEEHIKRIIVNFGQMKQQGKITGMELRDLARGAFVPVNDILERVADNLGITQDQLTKLRQKGLTEAETFFVAFSGMVDEDFEGAAQNMRRALGPAIDNIKEVFRSLLSWQAVVPVMDLLGEKLSDITDAIVTNESMWNRLTFATDTIGEGIVSILEGILGLAPSAATIAEKLVGGFEDLAKWINRNRDEIVGFFKDKLLPAVQGAFGWIATQVPKIIGLFKFLVDQIAIFRSSGVSSEFLLGFGLKEETVTKILAFIQGVRTALDRLTSWVQENSGLISTFFGTLGEIVSTVFGRIMEWLGKKVEGGDILQSITDFMQYVVENKDKITDWVETIVKAIIVWQALSTVWSIVMGIVIPLIGFIASLIGVFTVLTAIVNVLGPAVGAVLPWLTGFITIVGSLIAIVKLMQYVIEAQVGSMLIWWEAIKATWQNAYDTIVAIFDSMIAAGKSGDWSGVGKAIIDGIVNYFKVGWDILKTAITKTFRNAIDTAKRVLGISSPSTVFMGIGANIIDGMVRGITNGVSRLVSAARNAAISAYNAAMAALGAHSPSKLFMDIGEFTMEGFAIGIEKAAGLAVGAMQNAVGQVAMPAFSSMAAAQASGNTITNNRTANLTVNSSARTEPILQDFNMLESLMGA